MRLVIFNGFTCKFNIFKLYATKKINLTTITSFSVIVIITFVTLELYNP